VVQLLPFLLVVALVGGLGYAVYLRSSAPEVYQGLTTDLERLDVDQPATQLAA